MLLPFCDKLHLHWVMGCVCLVGALNMGASAQTTSTTTASDPSFWFGRLETPGRQFRFVVEAHSGSSDAEAESSPERFAFLVSLDEGETRFPLANFVANDRQLAFEIPSTQAKYAGEFEPSSGRFQGFWEQRGGRFALDFQPAGNDSADRPTETWRGTINLGALRMLMQFRVYETPDGARQVFIDSLTQKAGGFTATVADPTKPWSLEIPALRATFQGELTDDEQTLKGQWTQAVAINLELRRVPPHEPTPAAEPAPARPQHPQPPFPYTIDDVRIPIAGTERYLAGTVTTPAGTGPFPLAVLISGSGPQDRDSTLFDHKPFWVWADHLTRRGIAVLRFDERGVGQSPGDFAAATTMDLADDVAAVVEYARGLPRIDPQQIGLIGHSEGGLIGPRVAAQDPQLAWLVLLAGPGVRGEEILYSQGEKIVKAEGGSEQQARQQRQVQTRLFQALQQFPAAEWSAELEANLVSQLRTEIVSDGTELSDEELAQLELAIRNGLSQVNSPWFRFFLTYEPGPTLEQVRCPVLAINGSLDLQVDPQLNLPRIREALERGGNPDVTVRELPNLNHLFQTCESGAISRYAQIEETIAPVALEMVTEWIRARTSSPQ